MYDKEVYRSVINFAVPIRHLRIVTDRAGSLAMPCAMQMKGQAWILIATYIQVLARTLNAISALALV